MALIQPFTDYCCSSWYSGVSVALKKRLDVLQRKMFRFIKGLGPRDHVDRSHLRDLSWLCIPDRVSYFKMMHLFRIRHKLAPAYLMSNFKAVSTAHSHDTRGSHLNFVLPHYLSKSPNSFSFTAIKHWNALPNDLKEINIFRVFKQRLKSYLLSKSD